MGYADPPLGGPAERPPGGTPGEPREQIIFVLIDLWPLWVIDPLHDDVRIKTTRGARCTAGGFRVAGRLLTRKTREALTRWISCRGLTTSVAESHSILACTKVTK